MLDTTAEIGSDAIWIVIVLLIMSYIKLQTRKKVEIAMIMIRVKSKTYYYKVVKHNVTWQNLNTLRFTSHFFLFLSDDTLYNCGRIVFILSFFVGYILSFGLVRLRTIRLSARVGAHIERRCSRSFGEDVTITDVIIKTPDRK